MKKNTILTVVLAVSLLASCSALGLYKISKAEDLKEIIKKAEEIFTSKNVIGIEFYSKDHLTEDFGMMTIYYFENDKVYTRAYVALSGKWAEASEDHLEEVKSEEEKTLRLKNLSDFNFDDVLKTKEEAIKLLQTMTDEFEDFSIYNYKKSINSKGENVKELTIEGTKKSESTQIQGKNLVTNYYEFQFKTNAEGNLEYVE